MRRDAQCAIYNRITKFLFSKFRGFTHNQCVFGYKIAFYLKIAKKIGNKPHKYVLIHVSQISNTNSFRQK